MTRGYDFCCDYNKQSPNLIMIAMRPKGEILAAFKPVLVPPLDVPPEPD